MKIKVLLYYFISVIFSSSCNFKLKGLESEQHNCKDYKIENESYKQRDSLIFLKGKITQDFLGGNNKFSISDSCIYFLPKYYNNDLIFYSGIFQGEGFITILYKLDGDIAKDILYHPGKLVDFNISNNNLLYKIYAEDCCAGINVREHEFLLNSDLKSQRLHSIFSIKGTQKPTNVDKNEEFIIQQDTIELRLTPTAQSEFNFELQTEDNIIALFKKGDKGNLLTDSISNTENKHWYYVEIKDFPIPNTHYWYYENNDSTNISYIGWIEEY